MITEDYVSFELAKLLREKGFNEVCRTWYFGEDRINNNILIPKDKLLFASDIFDGAKKNSCIGYPNAVTAPTLQMAMKWLREVHNLCIAPYAAAYRYGFTIDKADTGSNLGNERKFYPHKEFETYEEAVEAALKYTLKNLI